MDPMKAIDHRPNTIVDIPDMTGAENEIYAPLSPINQRHAEMIAVDNTTAWIKEHPGYSMEELKKVKADFLQKARKTVQELEAQARQRQIEKARKMQKHGATIEEIAQTLGIPESQVKAYLSKDRETEGTHAKHDY